MSELRQELASKNEQLLTTRMHHVALQDEKQAPSTKPVTVGRWRSLPDVSAWWCGSSAVIGDKTYIKSLNWQCNNQWNELPSCPNSDCTNVTIDDMLTTVGGRSQSRNNKLYCYNDNQWVEHFPPMLTKRQNPAAVYASKSGWGIQ